MVRKRRLCTRWDSIISSNELGIQKPAPEIYAAALQQLGVSASQAIFIGHDAGELQGAHTAGMKTIALIMAKPPKPIFISMNFPTY